jgi:hypothetical protein
MLAQRGIVTTQLQVARSVGTDTSFTNLPAEWLQDQWFFPKGEISGVGGALPERVRFDWTGIHPALAAQLTWTLATRCLSGQWRAQNLAAMRGVVKRVVGFLREDASEATHCWIANLDSLLTSLKSCCVSRSVNRSDRSHPGGVAYAPTNCSRPQAAGARYSVTGHLTR